MNREPEERFRATRLLSLYLTIPILLLVSPLVGLYLGKLLDRLFHTDPVFMIVFLALGFVAGGREIYRILSRVAREEEKAAQARRLAEAERWRTAEEERLARDLLARTREGPRREGGETRPTPPAPGGNGTDDGT